jgi:hypothetical protein
MPCINSSVITPITWGPEESLLGRGYPHSGNPIIPIIPISPITGAPQISVVRTGRLGIYYQRRRRYPDGNSYADLGLGAYPGKGQGKTKNEIKVLFHIVIIYTSTCKTNIVP